MDTTQDTAPGEDLEEDNAGPWAWSDGTLVDAAGIVIAHVTAEVLGLGATRLLLETPEESCSFHIRATAGTGAFGVVNQDGFTVSRLRGMCEDREYVLRRPSLWKRNRDILLADGRVGLRTKPTTGGRLDIYGGPGNAAMPIVDVAFLTWVCVLVDTGHKPLKI